MSPEPTEPAQPAEKDTVLSKKTDRHVKDSPPSADETHKASKNVVSQVTGD